MNHATSISRFYYPAGMGLCATLLSFPYLLQHSLTQDLPKFLLCFTGVFSGYYLAGIAPQIRLNASDKEKIHTARTFLVFLPPAVLLWLQTPPPALLLQYIIAGLLTLGYYLRWQTGSGIFGGLRTLPYLKNITLATAWSLTTAPLSPLSGPAGLLFLHRFFYLLALSIIIDLRDLEEDRTANLRTIPIRLPITAARLLSLAALLCAAAAAYGYHLLTPAATLPPVWTLSLLCTAGSILLLQPHHSRNAYLLHVDGNFLLYSLLTAAYLHY